jgi:putative transposase
VFSGDYKQIVTIRQQALDEAFAKHPQRFSQGRPLVKLPPAEVCINPIPEKADQNTIETGVNFPTLPRVKQKAI